jgi:hypothetical protein
MHSNFQHSSYFHSRTFKNDKKPSKALKSGKLVNLMLSDGLIEFRTPSSARGKGTLMPAATIET